MDGKFRFFYNNESSEGGYEETTIMRMQPGKESVLRTGTETQGFFKLVDGVNTEWLKVNVNPETNKPTIEDFCEPIEHGAKALLRK